MCVVPHRLAKSEVLEKLLSQAGSPRGWCEMVAHPDFIPKMYALAYSLGWDKGLIEQQHIEGRVKKSMEVTAEVNAAFLKLKGLVPVNLAASSSGSGGDGDGSGDDSGSGSGSDSEEEEEQEGEEEEEDE